MNWLKGKAANLYKKNMQNAESDLANDADIIAEAAKLEQYKEEVANGSRPTTASKSSSGHQVVKKLPVLPFRFVRLASDHRSHDTAALLEEIGGPKALYCMVGAFYQKMFQDSVVNYFVRDQSEPHHIRLGNWFVEKMDATQDLWTQERSVRGGCPVSLAGGRQHVVHDRTSAHVAAWHSPARPPQDVGRRFKLNDTRIWMRLMFWSARETGVFAQSPSFENWFIRFIGHFISVYERSAPQFAQEAARWSENPKNIERYINSVNPETGWRSMEENLLTEVAYSVARRDIPVSEFAERSQFPYNKQ